MGNLEGDGGEIVASTPGFPESLRSLRIVYGLPHFSQCMRAFWVMMLLYSIGYSTPGMIAGISSEHQQK